MGTVESMFRNMCKINTGETHSGPFCFTEGDISSLQFVERNKSRILHPLLHPPRPSFDASAELFAELLPTSHNVAAGVFTKRLGGDRRQRPPPSSHPDPRIHPPPHTYHQSSQLGGGRRTGLLPSASCCAANARR